MTTTATRKPNGLERQRHKIRAQLAQHQGGLTVHEIATKALLDPRDVGRRIRELELDGQAYVPRDVITGGDMTRKPAGGREGRVWCLTMTGLAIVAQRAK
jgi:predicted ArsR family transcriptional regulator